MLALYGVPADHDTQSRCLGPLLNCISIYHLFFIDSILAIPALGVVYYLQSRNRYDQIKRTLKRVAKKVRCKFVMFYLTKSLERTHFFSFLVSLLYMPIHVILYFKP